MDISSNAGPGTNFDAAMAGVDGPVTRHKRRRAGSGDDVGRPYSPMQAMQMTGNSILSFLCLM